MAILDEGRHSCFELFSRKEFGQFKLHYSQKVTFNESCGLQLNV